MPVVRGGPQLTPGRWRASGSGEEGRATGEGWLGARAGRPAPCHMACETFPQARAAGQGVQGRKGSSGHLAAPCSGTCPLTPIDGPTLQSAACRREPRESIQRKARTAHTTSRAKANTYPGKLGLRLEVVSSVVSTVGSLLPHLLGQASLIVPKAEREPRRLGTWGQVRTWREARLRAAAPRSVPRLPARASRPPRLSRPVLLLLQRRRLPPEPLPEALVLHCPCWGSFSAFRFPSAPALAFPAPYPSLDTHTHLPTPTPTPPRHLQRWAWRGGVHRDVLRGLNVSAQHRPQVLGTRSKHPGGESVSSSKAWRAAGAGGGGRQVREGRRECGLSGVGLGRGHRLTQLAADPSQRASERGSQGLLPCTKMTISTWTAAHPSIAQLVERRTVDCAGLDILRSLVRFRLEGSARLF